MLLRREAAHGLGGSLDLLKSGSAASNSPGHVSPQCCVDTGLLTLRCGAPVREPEGWRSQVVLNAPSASVLPPPYSEGESLLLTALHLN